MQIPKRLFVHRQLYKDDRGSLQLLQCPTTPLLNSNLNHSIAPTQTILSRTNPYTGRGLHFQRESPLLQMISVIHGEIIECLVERNLPDNNSLAYSQKIKSTDENNTFIIPNGWAHGFYTTNNPATLIYMVWGVRNLEDEFGLNLKSKAFNFLDEALKEKITMNERDSHYEYI